MNVRYATEEDMREWFEGAIPVTMRAVVVEKDGKLLGIGGISMNDTHMLAFSRVKDELRRHKITIGRAAVMVRKMMQDMQCVWAVCSPTEPTAPGLLAWAGFEHFQDGVWCRRNGGASWPG